jgi:hypothetical protein
MTIPDPEAGLVISYAYLWRDEHLAGREEGVKDRPSVVVLVIERKGDEFPSVTVLPITHSPPGDPKAAIEIPARIKSHLGLDDARSWIVVSEGNEFTWPGFDLRKRPNCEKYEHGILPGRFFDQVVEAFLRWDGRGQSRRIPRD